MNGIMETEKDFLVIIPAYNEEENIGDVLTKLHFYHPDVDVLVINDGSTDDTANVVRSFPVKMVTHPTNLGYLTTLQTGFKYAMENGYNYVIQFDADGQHEVMDIDLIREALMNRETDIVIGSRFLSHPPLRVGWAKKLVISFFRFLIRLLTHIRVTDPTSGFRGYKRDVFKSFTEPNGLPNEFPDSNFILELLLNNYRIIEVPARMKPRLYGQSMHNGIKSILYFFQVSLSILIVWLRHAFRKRMMTK
ncbi:MAG: glycosyltransferase family 2 protein [Tuberibacillus sp.]